MLCIKKNYLAIVENIGPRTTYREIPKYGRNILPTETITNACFA